MQPSVRPFDLKLGPIVAGGTQFEIRVLDSPAGPMLNPVTAPEPSQDPDVSPLLHATRTRDTSDTELRQLGVQLYGLLARGEVQDRLYSSLDRVKGPDEPLRLRLTLEARRLVSVPWELTFDERQGSFLGADPRLRVARLVEGAAGGGWGLRGAELGVLIALGALRNPAVASLSRQLTTILDPLPALRAEPLDTPATLPTLVERLRGPSNILQLFVRAGFEDDAPRIYLPDAIGNPMPVRPDTLAAVLRGSGVPLAVLSASSTEEGDALLTFAAGLVQAGTPAVVAVPTLLSPASAQIFWHEFYYNLTAEARPLDDALTAGRIALWRQHDPVPTWYRPVLFTTPDESALWPLGSQAATQEMIQQAQSFSPDQRYYKSIL